MKEESPELQRAYANQKAALDYFQRILWQEVCPTCHGDRTVESAPAGAGHEDDLAEHVSCPDCAI